MTTAKLIIFMQGKYRRSKEAVVKCEDDVQSIKKAVQYLQQFFDISVQFDYQTKARFGAPKPAGQKKPQADDGAQISFDLNTDN